MRKKNFNIFRCKDFGLVFYKSLPNLTVESKEVIGYNLLTHLFTNKSYRLGTAECIQHYLDIIRNMPGNPIPMYVFGTQILWLRELYIQIIILAK